jgi:hypothetical protein
MQESLINAVLPDPLHFIVPNWLRAGVAAIELRSRAEPFNFSQLKPVSEGSVRVSALNGAAALMQQQQQLVLYVYS